MTDQQRKNIIRKCKKHEEWISGETAIAITIQDELIKKECELKGFTFHDFYFCEQEKLNKLLSE